MATAGSEMGGKTAEKLTFNLNGGGTGRRDAAVTMQGRVGFFFLLVPLKQDLWPCEYHHILAADVHCGWFI